MLIIHCSVIELMTSCFTLLFESSQSFLYSPARLIDGYLHNIAKPIYGITAISSCTAYI